MLWLKQQHCQQFFEKLHCTKKSHLFCFDKSHLSDDKIMETPEVSVGEVKYV